MYHSNNYKKIFAKLNGDVSKKPFVFVDGVLGGKNLPKNYVVVRGEISVPASDVPQDKKVARTRAFSFGRLFMKRNFFFGALSSFLVILNVIVPLSAFEAHILNVTATIKPRACSVATFDKDATNLAIVPGQIIDTEYKPWGLTVSADNAHIGTPDLALAFGSDNPTGGDLDLGTPNTDFGGPGVGVGGELGEIGENNRLEHNLLIIGQDNVDADSNDAVDDPSDEPDGGVLLFTFDAETRVESLRFIDIETLGVKVELYNAANVLIHTQNISPLGDNSSQYVHLDTEGVLQMKVSLTGEGAIDSVCFDPVSVPQICDARSKGYWANHEGCLHGDGATLWETQVQALSASYSSVFAATSGTNMCTILWTPNCPSGNTVPAKLCKAKAHLLADELNVVSGKLALDAFIAGAHDGNSAFSSLGLTPFSTVGQAIGAVEAVLANPSSTKNQIDRAAYVAQRVYTFYENENPFSPQCIFDPEEVPQCLAGNIDIDIDNHADIENNVETSSNTGGNSANGGSSSSSSSSNSSAEGGNGGTVVTGNSQSTTSITNIVNQNTVIVTGSSTHSTGDINALKDKIKNKFNLPEMPHIPDIDEITVSNVSVPSDETVPEQEEIVVEETSSENIEAEDENVESTEGTEETDIADEAPVTEEVVVEESQENSLQVSVVSE